jgi:hypothetical protein
MPCTGEQHSVYLAVPGNTCCWGTVVGVVHATARHDVQPDQRGVGFSGEEDFNLCWCEAINLFEAGEITHFAMLHGDLDLDPSQRWLDILLDEMDAHGAALVSAAVPLKDTRGLTSSGIADLENPWEPWRRFTLREIWHELPATFDNVHAGYPDRPLLHNTGLWVCDLRYPEFRAVNPDGELDIYFRFPTRAIRNAEGRWVHQRESEDWEFSRQLWLRGLRRTYITRRVRVTHQGSACFTNHGPWGSYRDGDEETAAKWRSREDAKPLRPLQLLQFELSDRCNLADQHPRCPNRHRPLPNMPALDDRTIVRSASEAYRDLGFTGLVGWAYYNEPLLDAERMFALMGRIRFSAPQARFLLWTNGTLVPEDARHFDEFSQIIVSDYGPESRRGYDRLRPILIENASLDDRLQQLPVEDAAAPCLRPFVELAFDCRGGAHICCHDWRGGGSLGNLNWTPFGVIARHWRAWIREIAGERMTDLAPDVCDRCGRRQQRHQVHDEGIVARADRIRAQWKEPSGA